MIETFREFTFEAAHRLPPYSEMHGHSFKAEIVLAAEPHPVYGWAASLTELDSHVAALKSVLDEKCLNEIPGLEEPSLENVARWIWQRLSGQVPNLARVKVSRGRDGQAEGCSYSS